MAPIAAGERFPPVALPDPEGTMRPLSHAWAEGAGLLVLGHADCETTRLALAWVDRIHRKLPRPGAVVAILQEDAGGARRLAAELGLALPSVLDQDPYLFAEQLGVQTVPTLVLVDREGVVRRVVEGFDREALEAVAAELGAAPLFLPGDGAPRLRPG